MAWTGKFNLEEDHMSKSDRYAPQDREYATQCPFCGRTFEYTMYPEIIIPGDSKLKKKVLNKTLFFPKCPYCGKEFKLKAGCMYRNDIKKEIFIVTDLQDATFENMMKTEGANFFGSQIDDDLLNIMKGLYVRRVVHDVDAFREKILLSDNNYDDRIIELMKLSLSGLLEKENHMPVYRIFLEDTAGSQLEFTAIMGAHAPFEYVSISTAANVYYQYRDKYHKKLGRPEEDEYIATDQEWAEESGLLENEDPGFVIPFD